MGNGEALADVCELCVFSFPHDSATVSSAENTASVMNLPTSSAHVGGGCSTTT